MRLALVLNSRSGGIDDPGTLTAAIRDRCDALTVHEPGEHAAAIASEPDRLVVAGGDGTIAPCFEAAARANVPLAVLPAGTANDFARALGIPLDLGEATTLATAERSRTEPVWGGLIGERPFVNVASAGLATGAARRSERLKRVLGPLAYPAGAVATGLAGQPVRASVRRGDHGELLADGQTWQLMIGASGRFGGGAGLGEAEPGDHRLVAAWIPAGPRTTLPVRAFGLLRRTIEQQAGVRWWREQQLTVTAGRRRPARWNVDGELWRPPSPTVLLRPLGPAQVVVSGPDAGAR